MHVIPEAFLSHPLLTAPIGRSLWRLAAPTTAVMIVQTFVAIAETYSHVLFTGSAAVWANFFFAALLRGGGDAATPGRYMLISSILQIPLSGVLALGLGDWNGLGMAGPAASSVITMTCAAA